MKKHILSLLLFSAAAVTFTASCQASTPPTGSATQSSAQTDQKPKYIFYFIGDGMGVNQVNAAETYLGQLEGKFGPSPLCFSSFPHTAFVTTYSANSGVTDSAAAGTALATGHKTKNDALGLDETLEHPVNSIAWTAQQNGMAVGITTTVTTDHATPAAFYAHTPKRSNTEVIRKQRSACGYDFIMGAPDGGKLPYRLDRKPGELSQADIVRMAIDSLQRVGKDGFFLMSEGGMIDYAAHSNDAGAMIGETLDFDDAIRLAYQFYEQHPNETLIVVTADHETGGLVLTHGRYEIHLDRLQHQKMTINHLGTAVNELRKELGDAFGWETIQEFLKKNFGFNGPLKLTEAQQKRLKTAFYNTENGKGKSQKSLYQEDSEFCVCVRQILLEQAHVNFAHLSHSAGYVPCFAIGVGADQFHGRIDNTDIPKLIIKAAGWNE